MLVTKWKLPDVQIKALKSGNWVVYSEITRSCDFKNSTCPEDNVKISAPSKIPFSLNIHFKANFLDIPTKPLLLI